MPVELVRKRIVCRSYVVLALLERRGTGHVSSLTRADGLATREAVIPSADRSAFHGPRASSGSLRAPVGPPGTNLPVYGFSNTLMMPPSRRSNCSYSAGAFSSGSRCVITIDGSTRLSAITCIRYRL